MKEEPTTAKETTTAAVDETKTTADSKENVRLQPLPPLEAAARRLERLLGGGLSDKDRLLHSYSNPTKVVRRWLGTSSGAAAKATSSDIAQAASRLLDPQGPCANGRNLLVGDAVVEMEVEIDKPDEGKDPHHHKYLSSLVSSREVESWLMSLQVRLLWKEKKFAQALDLAQQGIAMLLQHLESYTTTRTGVSASSLFPLLARMYRYRSLVAESLPTDAVPGLRQDMVKAHNMACLRRDVDSQATLLNLMLRDLLNGSQSM